MKNSDGLIPYQMTKDTYVLRLLAWAEDQVGYYPLITPPRIIIFSTNDTHSSAQEEREGLVKALTKLGLSPVVKLNPTEDEMYATIRENQEGEVSALIVVVMGQGDGGAIKVRNGFMGINRIMEKMTSKQMESRAKVSL